MPCNDAARATAPTAAHPTSALDPEWVGTACNTMVEFAADSVTMVRVVGEMGVVRAVADRVVLMVEGEILGTVPPTELFLTPRHSRTRP